ncbi:hypothetical protein [Heliorestis convoluta]|uniref:DUF2325 domain-containing protein n=1 Tax=Heliorestis convoluta TaxID=356322 RepID=A0A5Q2MVU6_9FIRM|nr:hypothetical protein [Heliorestis convoluta]QGG46328.1 hypothetical protein FTV88_0149 [Heliorestis convoluta]
MNDSLHINILPFLVETVSGNTEIYQTIDRIYEKDKSKFHQLARESEFYNHEAVISSSLQREIYGKKVLGILLDESNNEKNILELVRKGWKRIYGWVKANQRIDAEYLMKVLFREKSQQGSEPSDCEINGWTAIIIVTSRAMGKEIVETDGYNKILNIMNARLWFLEGHQRYSFERLSLDEKQKVQRIKKEVYKYAGVSSDYYEIREAKNPEILNWYQAYAFLFDVEKLSSSIVEEVNLSEEDINCILGTYYIRFRNQNKDEASKYFMGAHIIMGLLKAYKKAKKEYWKNNNETNYLDIEALHQELDQLHEEKRNLEKRLYQVEEKNSQLVRKVESEYKRAYGESRDKLRELENENTKLKKQLTTDQQEAHELRELFFRLDSSEEDFITNESTVDLSAVRGVIVGGHERWQTKMREKLKEWRFVSTDALNVDVSILNQAEIIFFFTGYLNHAMYDKLITEAKKLDVPVGYLSAVNEEASLKEISEQVERNSKRSPYSY